MIYNILKSFLKINNIDLLLKNLKAKLLKNEELKQKIPKPDMIFRLLRKNCELNNLIGYKKVLLIMKYFFMYTNEFDEDYDLNTVSETVNVKNYFYFAYQIFSGDKVNSDFENLSGWDYSDDAKIIIESDVYILLMIYFIDVLIDKKGNMGLVPLT